MLFPNTGFVYISLRALYSRTIHGCPSIPTFFLILSARGGKSSVHEKGRKGAEIR